MEPPSPILPQPPAPQADSWQPLTTPPARTPKRWPIIVLICTLAAGVIGLGIWYLLAPQGPRCLTRADYQTLAGETLPDEAPFAPTIDFYGFDVEFASGMTTYADTETETQIRKIGEFAAANRHTSLRVTLSAVYPDNTEAATVQLINARIDVLRSMLVQSGVQLEALTADTKTYAADPLDDADEPGAVSLALTSDEPCRAE